MHVVFDHPGQQVSSAVGRWIARLAGSLLVFLGLAATVVAIPAGFVLLGDIINSLQSQPEELFEPGFPLREVEAAFFAAAFGSFIGLRYGRRLIRGRRSIVLFLRRFGYDGSMQVVTYAVAQTIGVAWRLVTLDDDEIAPVGVDTTSRVVIRGGERFVALASKVGKGVMTGYAWSIWGICAVLGLEVLRVVPDWQRLLEDGTVNRYAAIFGSVMEGRLPVAYFAFSLSGAFAVLMTGAAVAAIGLLATFVILLAMFPLFGFVIFATSSADALRKAEQEKTATISESHQIAHMVSDLSRRGSQTFAPRLMVVRVASHIWQATVSALAAKASATIVDISDPSDNLAWEIQELDRVGGDARCVFIVDHARVTERATLGFQTDAADERVAALVGEREVLAYTTDRAGMRRFARALHGRLLDVPPGGSGGGER